MNKTLIALSISVVLGCNTEVQPYSQAIKSCDANPKLVQITNPITNDSTEVETTSQNCIEGFKIPEFIVETIDGEIVSNISLQGKLSIINFWFQNCPPCIAEIPGLNKLKEKYGNELINYIAISTDSKNDVKEFLIKRNFNFKHVADGESLYRNTFQGKWGFPFTIITDREGKILKSFGGCPTDSTAVNTIINKIEPIIIKEKAYR